MEISVSITANFFSQKKYIMASLERATCWSVTINNPTKSDDEWIAQSRQKSGWKVYGQLEKGENGTPHYQLMVTTPQVRFAALKKAFPRAHIEIARDRKALEKYVNKEETRVESLSVSQDKFPTHTKLMAWFGEYYDTYVKTVGHECFDNLEVFDLMIRQKITQGFYCETLGVNPQIRSAIKNYGRSIAQRERNIRRQTDRQTAENIVPDIDITNAPEDEAHDDAQSEEDTSTTQEDSS